MTDFDKGLKFRCFLHSHIGSIIFWQGSYSTDQLRFLDRLLQPDMVFVDVGANEGEYTIFAASRLKHGKVIAFEPISVAYERLVHNIQLNGFDNVIAIKRGLGEKTKRLPAFASSEILWDGTTNEGLATVYPTEMCSQPLETIDLMRLDDFVLQSNLQRLDVLKIDVEGSELPVLQGAEQAIRRFNPVMVVEVNELTFQAAGYTSKAMLDFIGECGYRFEVIQAGGKTEPLQPTTLRAYCDVVCIPLTKPPGECRP